MGKKTWKLSIDDLAKYKYGKPKPSYQQKHSAEDDEPYNLWGVPYGEPSKEYQDKSDAERDDKRTTSNLFDVSYGEPSKHYQELNCVENGEVDAASNLFQVPYGEPSDEYQQKNFNEVASKVSQLFSKDELISIIKEIGTGISQAKEAENSEQQKESHYIDYIVFKQLIQKYHIRCCQGRFIYLYTERYGCYHEMLDSELKVFIRKNVSPEIDRRLNDHKMNEVIKRLQSCPEVQVHYEDFDRHVHLINFLNGVYDVHRNEVLPHSPEFMFTSYINAEYVTEKRMDTTVRVYKGEVLQDYEGSHFMKLINDSTQGNPLKIKTIRQMFAYVISNYVRAKKFFILLGKAHSGKSLFANILMDLIGKEHTSGVPLHELGGKFQIAELFNKKLNLSPEIGEAMLSGTVEKIKALTGGDLVKAERKGEQPFFFVNKAKLIAVGNTFPEITKLDSALVDRMTLIIFNQSVEEKDRDKGLFEKIQSEKSFIVRWALEELRELERNDFIFTECGDALQFKKQFSESLDSVAQFFKYMCEIDPNNKELKAHRKQLYSAYTQFCKDNCIKACSQSEFFGEVIKMGVKKDKFRMNGSNALRGFRGIKVEPQPINDSENNME
ncbi:DNA primase family protein [Paenibacillus ehimensis]|uniref:DNA primase family protein n=1 Tax=Paenibacillus ehimensis TaxID=79264 RepID=UPI000FDB65FE|nr:phage/plasmid primase, P4 family [Paenibacillus ehimensis]